MSPGERVPCAHCGLPAVPPRDGGPAWCCLGCRLAHAVAGEGSEGEARWVQARILLAALFSVGVMMVSLILYSEDVFGSDIAASPIGQLFRWALLALSTPVLLLLAPSLLDPSAHGWRRLASLDLWVLVAVGAAWGLSVVRVFLGHGALYFDSAAMVLVLVTLGRWLDARAKVRVGAAADALRRLLPEQALRLRHGRSEPVPVEALRPGERIRVPAGERVPVDGRVAAGTASADFSPVTGEHEPRPVGPGEEVPAGARVLDGALDLEVTGAVGQRLLDRVAEALARARTRRTPAMRLADRLAGVLLPATLVLAAAVLAWNTAQGQADQGLVRALAVLLVSCPCSLGIATPLATWSALGAAMASGILVRDARVFETVARLRAALFDKTGTLTRDRRRLVAVRTAGPAGQETCRRAAAALAAASTHPAARALVGTEAPALPESLQVHPGRGVSGRVEGVRWLLGSPRFLEEQGAALGAELEAARTEAEAAGRSVLALARPDGAERALFVLAEELRPEAREVLQALRREGLHVEVLSGDAPAAAAAAARELGVPVQGNLLPSAKQCQVRQKKEQYFPLLYAGDGINDGPALAEADVSVAPAGGTEVARAAADVLLLGGDLHGVLRLRALARNTVRRIRFNLAWALAYNPLFLVLAATGRLSPVLCAAAMAASSLLVTSFSAARPVHARDLTPPTRCPPPFRKP